MQVHLPQSNEQYRLEVLQTPKGLQGMGSTKKLNLSTWPRQYDLEFMFATCTSKSGQYKGEGFGRLDARATQIRIFPETSPSTV